MGKIIKNKFGEELDVEVNEADNPDSRIILILHAFTGKKENRTIHFLAKNLPNMGYTTIQFDFSGHGKSQGNLKESTVSKQIEDIKVVLSQMNFNNVIVVGNSFSVITALEFAKQKEVCGLILLSGRANYLDYIGNLEKEGNKYKLYGDVFIDEKFVEDYKKYDPVKNIKKLNKPILIVHGDKDEVVSVKEAGVFLKNSKQARLKIIKGADHRYTSPKFKEEILRESIDFLKSF